MCMCTYNAQSLGAIIIIIIIRLKAGVYSWVLSGPGRCLFLSMELPNMTSPSSCAEEVPELNMDLSSGS